MKLSSARHFLFAPVALAALLFITGCTGSDDVSGNGQINQANSDEIELTITTPKADSFQRLRRLKVEGTASGVSEVEVNGKSTEVSGGKWDIMLTFPEGAATVTAKAGSTEVSVDFFVDTKIPELVLDSPARGTALDINDSGSVLIRGRATDEESGLFLVSLNGALIDHDDQGNFEVDYPLQEGLNIIQIAAQDRAKNEALESRAIIYGPLKDPAEPIVQALTLDMTPNGVASLADVIEAFATPETLMGLLGGGFGDQPLEITDLTWDEIDISLIPKEGFLEVRLFLKGFYAQGSYGADPQTATQGYIRVAQIEAEMDIALDVGTDNELDLTVLRSEVELEASDVESDLVGDNTLLRGLLVSGIKYAFTEFVPGLLEDTLYDPELLIQEVEFLGRQIEVRMILEEILVSPFGVRGRLGLEFPTDAHANVQDLPGALHRVSSADLGTNLDRPIRLNTTRTALDRILHSVWRAGLFHQTLGPEELSDFQLPFELTADSLASLLDQRIRDIDEPETPVELRFRPLLPPVVEFGKDHGDDAIMLDIGDFLIDFSLKPEGKAPIHFLTVALYLDVGVELIINDQEIKFDIALDAEGDIAEEPLFQFDRDRTVNLVTSLLELIPTLVGNDLKIDSRAGLEWASIEDMGLEINGQQRDRLTLGVRILPNDEFIADDEPLLED